MRIDASDPNTCVGIRSVTLDEQGIIFALAADDEEGWVEFMGVHPVTRRPADPGDDRSFFRRRLWGRVRFIGEGQTGYQTLPAHPQQFESV